MNERNIKDVLMNNNRGKRKNKQVADINEIKLFNKCPTGKYEYYQILCFIKTVSVVKINKKKFIN